MSGADFTRINIHIADIDVGVTNGGDDMNVIDDIFQFHTSIIIQVSVHKPFHPPKMFQQEYSDFSHCHAP